MKSLQFSKNCSKLITVRFRLNTRRKEQLAKTKKKKTTKRGKKKSSKFLRNVALLSLVGVSFLGGALYVLTTPDAKAEEAVHLTDTTNDFINRIGGVSQELASQYDLFGQENDLYASVMIAQAILESRSGTSGLSDAPYYNLFGVKGSYNGASAVFQTWEDDGTGNAYTIQDSFRQYPSWRASLEDYAQLLQLPLYQGAHRSVAGSYDVATAHLTGRYATDTQYASKLNNLIAAYNLTRFDDNPAVSSTSAEVLASGSVWNPHRRSFTSQAILDQDNAWLAYVRGE